MVRVEHLYFPLAKVLYDSFHRTNKPPVGHKQSFILIKDTGSYEPVSHYDCHDDLFTNWFLLTLSSFKRRIRLSSYLKIFIY